jgi:hypothetical protein
MPEFAFLIFLQVDVMVDVLADFGRSREEMR